jgi:hypothetical protein
VPLPPRHLKSEVPDVEEYSRTLAVAVLVVKAIYTKTLTKVLNNSIFLLPFA